ncbi:hypothetical protein QZH41_004572 [Actinostola sp. cb2023]|nr:hypothetical protein QZH41_004572 [Actinostola sp. cb2023]
MDIDDRKLLTQGGWTAHDVKYSTARRFINRCPMLVSCQEELEFDEGDKEAMDSRLNKYLFRRLPKKHFHAYAWIRKHPMDAIVWATRKSTTHHSQTDEGETIDGLSKQDQAELFQCSFEDIEIDEDENSVQDTQSCQEQIAGDHNDQSNAEDV